MTAAVEARHRSLHGQLAVLGGDGVDLSQGWSSWAEVSGFGGQHHLGAGDGRFAEGYFAYQKIAVSEEYSVAGGSLRVGGLELAGRSGRPGTTQQIGAWSGPINSMVLASPGDSKFLIELLDAFEITDTPEGVTAIPRTGSGVRFTRVPWVVKTIPGIGGVTVQPLTGDVLQSVPSYRGTAVVGGELFVNRSEGQQIGKRFKPPTTTFVLVSETAKATIGPDSRVPEADLVGALSRLTVQWSL